MDYNFLVPEHIVEKEIPLINRHVLARFAETHGITTFGDIEEEFLAGWHTDYPESFWDLIWQLGFYGVRFTGDLSSHTWPTSDNRILHFAGTSSPIQFVGILAPKRSVIARAGAILRDHLSGIPLDNFIALGGWALEIQTVVEQLSQQDIVVLRTSEIKPPFYVDDGETDVKWVYDGHKGVYIPRSLWKRQITVHELSRCRAIVYGLHNLGITTLGELPQDLEPVFSLITGVGKTKRQYFFDWLRYIVSEDHKSSQPCDEGLSLETNRRGMDFDGLRESKEVFFEDLTVVIDKSDWDRQIDFYDLASQPRMQPLARQLAKNGIHAFGDIPSNAEDLLRFWGVGRGRIRTLLYWIIDQLKSGKTSSSGYGDNEKLDVKRIAFGELVVEIPGQQCWQKIDFNSLRSEPFLRTMAPELRRINVSTLGDLPNDASSLLRLKGVGSRRVRAFLNWLAREVESDKISVLGASSEPEGKEIRQVSFEELVVQIPKQYWGEALDFADLHSRPFLRRMALQLRRENICRFGDVPENAGSLLRIEGVGRQRIRVFLEWLAFQISPEEQTGHEGFGRGEDALVSPDWVGDRDPLSLLYRWQPQLARELRELKNRHGYIAYDRLSNDIKRQVSEWGYYIKGERAIGPSDLVRLFNAYVDRCVRGKPAPKFVSERNWTLAGHRLRRMIETGGSCTLEYLGQYLDVSRERVRQILPKLLKEVFGPSVSLLAYIEHLLDNHGPVVPARVLEDLQPSSLFCLADLLPLRKKRLGLDLNEMLLYVGEKEEVTSYTNRLKEDVQEELAGRFVTREELGRIVSDLEYLSASPDNDVSTSWTEWLSERYLDMTSDGRYYWAKGGNLGDIVTSAFKEFFPAGAHIHRDEELLTSKINKFLRNIFPNPRNIKAALERSEKVVLWGRGFYRHIECTPQPLTLLHKISDWLHTELRNAPIISIEKAFEEFKPSLIEAGIETPQGLNSLIKAHFSGRFAFLRYPRVGLADGVTVTRPEELTRFLEEHTEVGVEDLRREFIEVRGWKPYHLDQALMRSPDIVRLSADEYTLLQSLTLKDKLLSKIEVWLSANLGSEPISIRQVFKENVVTCISMGIQSPHCLFDVLRVKFEGLFHFSFPHVSRLGYQQPSRITNRALVERFLRKAKGSVFLSELKKAFIEGRGWTDRQLDNAIRANHDRVIRVGVQEYAHIKHLNWDAVKQEKLELLVLKRIRDYHDQDSFVINFRTDVFLPLFKELPGIGDTFAWSEQIMVFLLERSESVDLLYFGGSNPVPIVVPNAKSISTEEDFIADILLANFDGHARQDRLERFMQERGLIGKVLPKRFRRPTPQSPYAVLNNEFVHRSLIDV